MNACGIVKKKNSFEIYVRLLYSSLTYYYNYTVCRKGSFLEEFCCQLFGIAEKY